MTLSHVFYVAVGGAAGAVGRYVIVALVGALIGEGFPYSTIVVNVLGSFALGAMIETSALVWSPSPEVRIMIVTGILGAFTTFSTFSLDVVAMTERGELVPALAYVVVSVVASVAAIWAGMAALRSFLT